MNRMGAQARGRGGRLLAVGLLAALAGCTKAPPPEFRLNIQGDMQAINANLKLGPRFQAIALRPNTEGDLARAEELPDLIKAKDDQISELSEPLPKLEADLAAARQNNLESEIDRLQREIKSVQDKVKAQQQQRKSLADELAVIKGREIWIPALQKVTDVLDAAFGTPDEPFVFPESGLDLKKIRLASGSPSQPEPGQSGLYRLHCAHCHGINGDGAGTTAAFLNPYPRDYRQGVFKFKSTQFPAKPTRKDLTRTLVEGIPGTAMPSFALLPAVEIDALVEYVKYLSIRGQVEIQMSYNLLVADDEFEMTGKAIVDQFIAPEAETWAAAESQIIVPKDAPQPADIPPPESVAAGAALFHGEKAACVKCHGPTGLGDSEDVYYDNWNKDKEPGDIFWLLPKQPIKPRNLRLGIYRGGRRPLDLYRRIYAGIPGTPMPGLGSGAGVAPAAAAPPVAGTGEKLTDKEIWDLVNYVRSLPYDEATKGPAKATGPVAQVQ